MKIYIDRVFVFCGHPRPHVATRADRALTKHVAPPTVSGRVGLDEVTVRTEYAGASGTGAGANGGGSRDLSRR